MTPLMLETALSERDVATLHEWQEQQSRRVAELEVALDFERSEVARLMNLLIEAQANGNHLRRALERAQDAANCAWALLPAAQRVQMYTTSPRLAELASEGYTSAEDAQAQVIRAATEEATPSGPRAALHAGGARAAVTTGD